MKLNPYFTALMLFASCTVQSVAQDIQTTNLDGGSVVTDLGDDIKINKGSSLHRTWTVLNDPSCPIQLSDAGIQTLYEYRLGYDFRATGSAKTSKAVQAFEIRYLLYDVFGGHIRTLSSTEIKDLPSGATHRLVQSWHPVEGEVSQLLNVVAFVAQVRGEDGRIWRFNQKAVADELGRIQLKVAGVFDATKETKEKEK